MRSFALSFVIVFATLGRCLVCPAATLQFVPDVGVISTEGPNQVVTVDPLTNITFSVDVTTAAEPITAYQLEFLRSDIGPGELVLSNWSNNPTFGLTVDTTLGSVGNDTFVSSLSFDSLSVPGSLGSLSAAAPATPGDYLLTIDSQLGNTGDTDVTGELTSLPITDYGDTIVRVVPEPNALALLLVAVAILAGVVLCGRIRASISAARISDGPIEP